MAGIQAGVTAFRQEHLIPMEQMGWEQPDARQMRYALDELYYSNGIYKNLAMFTALSVTGKINKKLYKYIRPIYNPAFRLVSIYVNKVYGGPLDFQKLTGGAVPISEADDTLREAIKQVWLWSNWRSQKSVYVRTGAKLGDVFLKVVNDQEHEKVRMEVVHPGKVAEADFDAAGNITKVMLEYTCDEKTDKVFQPNRRASLARKTYIKTEIIDKEKFSYFKDGKPWDYLNNTPNGEFAEYENEYGFVPMVLTQHTDEGLLWGANAYHTALDKIDEINDLASLLHDQIRKTVNVVFYYAGAQQTQLVSADGTKDEIPAVYGPADSEPHPLIADINIADASAAIQNQLSELERDYPELSLHRLRDVTNPTAPGVRSAFNDAIDRFDEAQGNYDDGQIRATQMSISIGGYHGYTGFEAYNLDSFDKGDLAFDIQPRPIIEDQLTKQEKIGYLQSSNAPDRATWAELNVPEDTIKEWETEAEEQAEQEEAELDAAVKRLATTGKKPANAK